ncbi:unnamed protein product [Chironomus riparius]|uniref:Dynamin GTPase n=1 Tax=Chironomus riparius TaxID=315576 RepID=A0A9N9RMD2_9DIPT|nr:unnamed protein product [Chironomus riparius]
MEQSKILIMEDLIGAINKLQDIFNTLKIKNFVKLPQIVMLGSQLIKNKEETESTEFKEYGVFLHLPDKKFTDFDEIRKEIECQTDKLAGNNKGICKKTINLKICSPHVVNLTLVDLPGITKIPVGDQPEDIESQIKELIMLYIKNPNSIILSVSPANADLATSESIKYAKQVDPKGLRTLAVLTKLDIMDKGTNAWEILRGNSINVELGIIGTVNRSQQNNNDNKTIDEQLKDEKKFFNKNYKEIAHQNGIPYLSKRLSQLLMHHIKKCLPGLKMEINEELQQYQGTSKSCGETIKDRDLFIIKIVTQISKKIESIIEGTTMQKFSGLQNLIGGPKYRKIFDDSFNTTLKNINPEWTKEEIVNYILNFGGPRPLVFSTDFIFLGLIKIDVERLRAPSLDCVQNSHDEMEKIIMETIKEQQELQRFPILERKIQFHLKNLVNNQLSIAQNSVIELINTELSSVNTNHPDFSIKDAFKNMVNPEESIVYPVFENTQNNFKFSIPNNSQQQLSGFSLGSPQTNIKPTTNFTETFKETTSGNLMNKKTETEAKIIYNLIHNYFPIVKKTVQDQIPKIVMFKIINHMKDNMQNELLHKLLKENEVDLLKESKKYEQLRKNAEMMIEALKAAKKAIDDIEIRQ